MRKIIAAVGVVAALTLTVAPAAQAAPTFGQRHTLAHGYIVWTEGDARWSRVHCTWYAGNTSWHLNTLLAPHAYKWTTSDAGGWGDNRPSQLDCTYRRA